MPQAVVDSMQLMNCETTSIQNTHQQNKRSQPFRCLPLNSKCMNHLKIELLNANLTFNPSSAKQKLQQMTV